MKSTINQVKKGYFPKHLSSQGLSSNLIVIYFDQPLLRIFDPILKNASRELLHGSHTRSVSISTPSNSGIMKFAKKRVSCIGCRTPIRYISLTLNTSLGFKIWILVCTCSAIPVRNFQPYIDGGFFILVHSIVSQTCRLQFTILVCAFLQ